VCLYLIKLYVHVCITPSILQPRMSSERFNLINEAFEVFESARKPGADSITMSDLKSVYSVDKHPEYITGKKTEGELISRLLNAFDKDGDGEVSASCLPQIPFYPRHAFLHQQTG
jgi:Ca2+-binding EF-hand superfamily protein